MGNIKRLSVILILNFSVAMPGKYNPVGMDASDKEREKHPV